MANYTIPVNLLESWADNFDGEKLEDLVADIKRRVEYEVPACKKVIRFFSRLKG